jgi:hypothetical protein
VRYLSRRESFLSDFIVVYPQVLPLFLACFSMLGSMSGAFLF